jgi:hypothetical protein
MNYYVDIDGTIITKDRHEADGLHQFLTYVLESGEVYWLTTHCREMDTADALYHLKPILQPRNFALVSRIKGTQWQTLKTEAINMQQPFYWFDDYVLEAEKRVLQQHACLDRWVPIDLSRHNNHIIKAISQSIHFPPSD